MPKLNNLLGKKLWLGFFFVFLISLGVNALCSLLLVNGVLPGTSANGCVYAAWGVGGLVGGCIAVRGEDGTLLRSLILFALAFAATWLLGFGIFGSVSFDGYALGVAISLFTGCVLGGLFGGGKRRKRHKVTGKRRNRNRHKK